MKTEIISVKRDYTRINKNIKLELLKMTIFEGKSIKEAARKLKINSASARTIVTHYKKKGEI